MRSSGNDIYGGGGGGYDGGGRSSGSRIGKDRPLPEIDWTREKMNPINKDLYEENPAVTACPQFEIDQWITSNQGRGIPRPVCEFSEAPFRRKGIDMLYHNFQKPSVIQSISWPIAMSGRDIISIAKTGCGKTLALMLPGLMRTLAQTPRAQRDGPSILVFYPLARACPANDRLFRRCLEGSSGQRPRERSRRHRRNSQAPLVCVDAASWFTMRPTACWTWDSSPRSARSSLRTGPTVRL
ncbi:hypothetical protein PRIPAC_73033 [Pristionchus pacificus]|uniref:Helicase n=1 Tax=Pristionchus pacificus TaxID=54126 RepID=A0A2A6BFR5_PRIPA|nr:hypothetical protein PRIPAC_73033 [Pristionchus pacificus]|eukprot:PDM64755.1 helicase [Pristionchus pacificus]